MGGNRSGEQSNIYFYPGPFKKHIGNRRDVVGRRGTILLVEDNPDDELLTLRAFKKNNILNPLAVVHDGVEALNYLFGVDEESGQHGRELPVMVLLDLKLPKVDGLEVLQRIRADKRTRLLPVIILTSSNEEGDILGGYMHGANSYVCKPVDMDQFVQAVGRVGVYWLMVNEPAG
jgi:two-component system, response regulator